MKIVIHPEFLEQLNSLLDQSGSYYVYGKIYDDSSVVHLMGIDQPLITNNFVGSISINNTNIKENEKNQLFPVNISCSSLKVEDMVFIIQGKTIPHSEIDFIIVDYDRLFVRVDQKQTPLSVLANKKVVIIGLGSGGSVLALNLAKTGVKNFVFIDDDILETHNIIRHICDLSDLGRFKTHAVKDFIQSRIPDVSITTINKKFYLHTLADSEFFLETFKEADLIVAVSGEHTDNFSLNAFIHQNQLKVPIVFAGTFNGVEGGLLFKVDPSENTFCYHCVYAEHEGPVPTIVELEKKINYDRTLQEQIAQPGLGLDIDSVTLLVSKFCIDLLLKDVEHGLYKFPHNFYLWYNRNVLNRDGSIKFEGNELYFYEDLRKDKKCPFHGKEVEE